LHTDPKWLVGHLTLHTQALLAAQQQQVRQLNIPQATRSWQSRSRPKTFDMLRTLNAGLSPADFEADSDPENIQVEQERLTRRLRRMQQRARVAQYETARFLQCEQVMQQFRQQAKQAQPGTMTFAEWEAGMAQFHRAR
ncbi:uncharacterized protein CDV56_100059, partial [Aspergillus thermomutatus]